MSTVDFENVVMWSGSVTSQNSETRWTSRTDCFW